MFYGQMNLIIEVYLIYTVGESFRFHLQIMSSQNCMKEIFKKIRIPLQSNRDQSKQMAYWCKLRAAPLAATPYEEVK